MGVSGYEILCGQCERPIGDHTLREWAHCTGEASYELPHGAIPEDEAELVQRDIRERFLLGEDAIIADMVVIRSAVLTGDAGPLSVRIPALIHEFQLGRMGQSPVTVGKVVFLADTPESARAYGRLVRDSANGAANATERPVIGGSPLR